MNNYRFVKTAAQLVLVLFIGISAIKPIAYSQINEPTCAQVSGNYYIINELVRACGFLNLSCNTLSQTQAYPSEAACIRAATEKYGCIPANQDKIYYGTRSSNAYQVNFAENETSFGEAYACLSEKTRSITENRTPNYSQVGDYCSESTKFFQCKCSRTLIGNSGVIGEIISWSTGTSNYSCYMKEVTTPQLVEVKKVKPLSPFALFKTIADLMFILAIFIFVMNLLRIGLVYVRSGGVPDNLKAARTMLNNTIGGMVFLILVAGLIAYTTNVFKL